MSARKVVLLIVLGLLVVVGVAYWAGRAHEDDEFPRSEFDPQDRRWIRTVRSAAQAVGGLVGIGPEPLNLTRLRAVHGSPPVECLRTSCPAYGFSGTAELRIDPGDARYAELLVHRGFGAVEVRFQPAEADEEEEVWERLGREPLEILVTDAGGRLVLRCSPAADCSVRFRRGNDG